MAIQQLVKFSVADLDFGININQIFQIIKPQEVFTGTQYTSVHRRPDQPERQGPDHIQPQKKVQYA